MFSTTFIEKKTEYFVLSLLCAAWPGTDDEITGERHN